MRVVYYDMVHCRYVFHLYHGLCLVHAEDGEAMIKAADESDSGVQMQT